MKTKIINFQLFAEGEGGAAAEATTGTDGANALDTAEAPADAEVVVKTREEEYAEHKEKFKDLYQKDFDNSFGKRFKGMKQTEEELNGIKNDLAPLYKMYGVENASDLVNTILANPSTYADEAYKTGVDAEVLAARNMLEVERSKRKAEEERKQALEAEKERVEAVSKQLKAWEEESGKVKALHPEFDLRTEMSNPAFATMLRDGVPMLNIYRALHHEDIAKSIEDKAKKATTELIKNGQARPTEVGASSTKPINFDRDVNNLTDEEMEEIAERVRRGERITFSP
jgi:hypothetical protein